MSIIQEESLTADGVIFSVTVDSRMVECIVSTEVLLNLSKLSDGLDSPFDAYKAYKGKIHGVARRLVGAGIGGTPVVLRVGHF